MSEQWIKWEPIEGLSANNSIYAVIDNPDQFKIILSNHDHETKQTLITFDKSVDSYWFTKEILRINTVYHVRDHYGKDFLNWTFFKITNSNYLKLFSNKLEGSNNFFPYMHFSFFTDDECLCVIATYEPKIEFITEKEKEE